MERVRFLKSIHQKPSNSLENRFLRYSNPDSGVIVPPLHKRIDSCILLISKRVLSLLLLLLFLILGCQGTKIDQLLSPASPYEQYVKDLNATSLGTTSMVRQWIEAGKVYLDDTNSVELPHKELVKFDPAQPKAMALSFSAKEGQRIIFSINPISDTTTMYFFDVFEMNPNNEYTAVKSSLHNNTTTFLPKSDGKYALRLQPELLKGGFVELAVEFEGTLSFPIPEKTHRNIASFFGDVRDAGRRTHEGIDVFAPRGTPVVAVSGGRVTRVGNNRLGGKTVSLSSEGYSFYYAHLDSQLVSMGHRVQAGDTLGLVGNTGNAITTAPHLHFGIYGRGRRSLDPMYFFRESPELPSMPLADSTALNSWRRIRRIRSETVNLRSRPSLNSLILSKLKRNEVLKVEGKVQSWFRVRLPDQTQGFIADNLLESTETALSVRDVESSDYLKTHWELPEFNHAFVSGKAELLGHFGGFELIRTAMGDTMWLQKASAF